jgi:predicted HTH domain antitoxin
MTLRIVLDLPEGALNEAGERTLEAALKEEAILRLFSERVISPADATRLLGLSRIQFMELTCQRGTPYQIYTASDFQEDLKDVIDREARPESRTR